MHISETFFKENCLLDISSTEALELIKKELELSRIFVNFVKTL